MRWRVGPIPLDLELDSDIAPVAATQTVPAALRAAHTYVQALGTMTGDVTLALSVAAGAPAPERTGGHRASLRWMGDGWDDDYDPAALAVTVTSYDPTTGEIMGASIVLNAAKPWTATDDCRDAYDLQSVITHEVGHLFGLAHDTSDPEATMFPTAGECETMKRDLDSSDLDGLHYLYEVVPPPQGCAVVAGRRGGADGALWVLAALGAWLWRRRATAALAVVVGITMVASPAGATTLTRLSLAAAGQAARVVVRGRIVTTTAVVVNGRVYTDAVIAVDECLKGECEASYVVRQLGGETADLGTVVEGIAPMAAGDEQVLFLRERHDRTWAPVGMIEGMLRVERDARTHEVRAFVRDLRGVDVIDEHGGARGQVERFVRKDLERALKVVPAD